MHDIIGTHPRHFQGSWEQVVLSLCSISKEEIVTGLGPRHYTVHLRAILLLQFIEHLDKLLYNAYEGSSVTFPSPPKVSYPKLCHTPSL